MTDRPIIFSGPMVRAILDGRKTQTRRAVSPQPTMQSINGTYGGKLLCFKERGTADRHLIWPNAREQIMAQLPYQVDDRLWVRENWALHSRASDVGTVVYEASVRHSGWNDAHEQIPVGLIPPGIYARPFQEVIRPSIHMPRAFSRLTLIVTEMRIERLQGISEEDAWAEGVWNCGEEDGGKSIVGEGCDLFRNLWDSINGKPRKRKNKPPLDLSWAANPWVVAITFRVERGNIDRLAT